MTPTSGQILGAIHRAFDADAIAPDQVSCVLCSRGSRRYFREGRGSDTACCKISALALGLANGTLFPVPEGDGYPGHDIAMLIAGIVYRHAAIWDRVRRDAEEADLRGLLRLVVISLAIVDGHVRHATSADNRGVADLELERGAVMRRLKHEKGWTYDHMAEALGVCRNDALNWCRDVRPNSSNMMRIATRSWSGDQQLALYRNLRMHHGLCDLGELVERRFGAAFVEDLRRVYIEARACQQAALERQGAPRDLELFLVGSLLVVTWRDRARFLHVADHHGINSAWTEEVERALDLWGASDDVDLEPEVIINELYEALPSREGHRLGG